MQDERPYRVVPSGPIAWLTPEEVEARRKEKEDEECRIFLERQEELKKNAPQPWPAEQPIQANNANSIRDAERFRALGEIARHSFAPIRDAERLRALAEIAGELAQGVLPPRLSEEQKQELADKWNNAKSRGKPFISVDYSGGFTVGVTEDPWRIPTYVPTTQIPIDLSAKINFAGPVSITQTKPNAIEHITEKLTIPVADSGGGSFGQVTVKRDILAEMRENPLVEWAVKFGARYAGIKIVREHLEHSFDVPNRTSTLTITLVCKVLK